MPPMTDDRTRPSFWRSLAELEGESEFREREKSEFSSEFEEAGDGQPDRRRFLQVMGASLALGGATTACRWEKEEVLPLSSRPEGIVPGEPRFYSTSMELDGIGTGLRVTAVDGRPIKVEGNPLHPESLGAASIYQQASVLELYDPDRSTDIVRRQTGASGANWGDFDNWLRGAIGPFRSRRGHGMAVLAEPSSSPTATRLRRQLLSSMPEIRWVDWAPNNRDHEIAGAVRAFGAPMRQLCLYDEAAIVLALDVDPMNPTRPGALAAARALTRGRQPDQTQTMNRIYSVESCFSMMGALADHRLALRSGDIAALAALLDARLSARIGARADLGPPQVEPELDLLRTERCSRFVDSLVTDLLNARGRAVVVTGPRQPPQVHSLVHRLNYLLGNVGRTVWYLAEPDGSAAGPGQISALTALVDAMRRGGVEFLCILGGNPVLDAPADLDFGAALQKVPNSLHLASYEDETSQKTTWHLPRAHFLEAWGDTTAWDGTVSLAQPLIEPLYGGRSIIELLSILIDGQAKGGRQLVRETHGQMPDPVFRKALHDGVMAGTAWPRLIPSLRPLGKLNLAEGAASSDTLELVLAVDSNVYDGRFANNGWLVELPDPMTKVTWENVVCIAPKTAARLGIADGGRVHLTANGHSVTVTAVHAPGQAERSVKLALGWGRIAAGRVGGATRLGVPAAGTNAYVLTSARQGLVIPEASLRATGERALLATTQDLHAIDQYGREATNARLGMIVREATFGQWLSHPDFAKTAVHHAPLLQMWQPPVSYEGHRWGMSIDLGKCIGCNACMVACQAENNVPVVGKEQVARGREMHWLRVDRYYKGTPDQPEAAFQPVPCQQCENAPCEQVCPVGATSHSHEGLNDMAYNRCIGTRYCSNNCPYKVRRFNYFNFHLDLEKPENQVKKMVYNPDVTVRSRGVMEKCTFCVQRIERVKIQAKNVRRPIAEGEIVTACQQTCPTGAIVFGDLSSQQSQVSKLQALDRSYALLEELNTRPRVQYLARIRNPKPEST